MSAYLRCSPVRGRCAVPETQRKPRALIVDYGGVLTNPLSDTMGAWCESDGIEVDDFLDVMRDWLGSDAEHNPVYALESGRLAIPDFERQLAARLRTRDGQPVPAEGLLARMFAGFEHEPAMADVVRRAKAHGIKTGLLSNSWGMDYPRENWPEMFDAVVISGEVGMRKPDPEIYDYAAKLLDVVPEECVFVDDLGPNVKGAAAVGMVGVRHITPAETIAELEILFGVSLRGG